MPIIAVNSQSLDHDNRCRAQMNDILATIGGLAIAIYLLGRERISHPGELMQPIGIVCAPEEASIMEEILNDVINDKGIIVFSYLA